MNSHPKFKLEFKESEISQWADQYEYKSKVEIFPLAKSIKQQGYLTLEQLKEICEWKTPRSRKKVKNNSEEYVRTISSFSLSTKDERSRIESLTLLDGVRWPTASVILHFCHHDPYPILDFRALESFGIKEKNIRYNYEFWCGYVDECRKIADKTGLDMRTIDKALWQYSKGN